MSKPRTAYTGRQLILQSLEPLRRAHLEGKIEGLEKAIRLIQDKPDHSGRLLASVLQESVREARLVIIAEAEKAHAKEKPE